MAEQKRVHVVAAVIEREGRILIARRHKNVHQGGKWEFPGGKVEGDEGRLVALQRELQEELGIVVARAEPLIDIAHDYPDKSIRLDVWRVTEFDGCAGGMEGQEIRWVVPDELSQYRFPKANISIVTAARLPREYVISAELAGSVEGFLDLILAWCQQGKRLIQIRTKRATVEQWKAVCSGLNSIVAVFPDVILMINSDLDDNHRRQNCFSGVHLTSQALAEIQARPEGYQWVSASCHNLQEIKKAEQLGVDFVTVSPVLPTQSHADADSLGWKPFAEWVKSTCLPVFALGGMQSTDLRQSFSLGAQGIAGIGTFQK